MDKVVEICFKFGEGYYACIVTIIHRFDNDYICIELLDPDIIAIFKTSEIMYMGENGYKKLTAFEDKALRPILVHLGNLVASVQHLINDHI